MSGIKKKLIRLSKSCLGKDEKSAVSKVLNKEFLGMGNEVKKFETELRNFFKREALLKAMKLTLIQVLTKNINLGFIFKLKNLSMGVIKICFRYRNRIL